MHYEKVLYRLEADVARIALNEPESRNASSERMGIELLDALDHAGREARAIVLTGEGDAFCSGANLKDTAGLLGDPMRDVGRTLERYFNPAIVAISTMEIPVITAIRGAAVGIGCGLAMAGDLIVCGKGSFFLLAFRHVGLAPDGGSSWLLSKAIGRVRAMELMLLGNKLYAQQALEWGLVTRVVPDSEVEATAMLMAGELATGARSLGMIKRVAWAALDSSLETALTRERLMQREACRTEDFIEGVAAFRERRQPRFKGS
jgi:2-(1,2-epoxy-1,2-dihydrophenyl)acetyl-CoA isomerase